MGSLFTTKRARYPAASISQQPGFPLNFKKQFARPEEVVNLYESLQARMVDFTPWPCLLALYVLESR